MLGEYANKEHDPRLPEEARGHIPGSDVHDVAVNSQLQYPFVHPWFPRLLLLHTYSAPQHPRQKMQNNKMSGLWGKVRDNALTAGTQAQAMLKVMIALIRRTQLKN